MDDLYIYHAYTLSILLSLFQKKQRLGRLNFQEREDDMDMTASDAAETIGHVYNNQVNSTNNNTYYYFTIQNGNTS